MTKEMTKRLWAEMEYIDLNFEQIADVIGKINKYLFSKREANRAEEDEEYRSFLGKVHETLKKSIMQELGDYGLYLTFEDIESEDETSINY